MKRLSKYNDPIETAREGLTPEEARAVAREDSRLIYLVMDLRDIITNPANTSTPCDMADLLSWMRRIREGLPTTLKFNSKSYNEIVAEFTGKAPVTQ